MSPTAAEGLTPNSSDEEIQRAVSSCISQMASEHPEWDRARHVAACYSMAREATGKPLAKKRTRKITGLGG